MAVSLDGLCAGCGTDLASLFWCPSSEEKARRGAGGEGGAWEIFAGIVNMLLLLL